MQLIERRDLDASTVAGGSSKATVAVDGATSCGAIDTSTSTVTATAMASGTGGTASVTVTNRGFLL